MKNTSIPYRDSTAFRKALDYICKTNYNLYLELLEIKCIECGIID